MRYGLQCIARLAGEHERRRQCRDADTEIEQSVAVRGKGVRVGWTAGANDEGASRVGGVGPVVFGLGIEIVWGARRAGARKSGKWGRRLSKVMHCGLKYAVMVDGGDVGSGGWFGL